MISDILWAPSRSRAIFVVFIISFILTQSALAGFKVERSIIEEEVTPGVPLNEKILLYNEGINTDLNVEINVFGFGQKPDGSILLLEADEDSSPYSARGYITLSDDEITLKPGWDDEIDVEAKIPEDMGDGSKYAVIQFKIPYENETTGEVRDWGVLVPVLLTNPNSNLIKGGEIADLSIEWPNATVLFNNNGNTHIKPIITTLIKDGNEEIVKEISTTTAISIIPGFSRQYKIDLDSEDELIPGDYSLEISVRLEDSNNLLDNENEDFRID